MLLYSGNSSHSPIAICETDCTGKESRLTECYLKTCDDNSVFQSPCKKENIVGVYCSKSYRLKYVF